ncbi:hypothetical protein GH714_003650 [Hevea brasiliensis]|uniref:Retroviral polymerase SH3-like domain-containing protein n=1 Tax=Hevea brasiliensis TaxID=3981 RepID=A0A6A6N1C3_HEVBR|nr:hypothetical protein GH714_003650 [Hevea brasiliensis]
MFRVSLTNSAPNGVSPLKWLREGIECRNEKKISRPLYMLQRIKRSKLYSKKWQSIFLGYAQDEFRYRLYDLIEKKLVKSRDVVFFEDQTIEDIEKVESLTPQNNEKLSVLDPIPLRYLPGVIKNGAQGGVQDDVQECIQGD